MGTHAIHTAATLIGLIGLTGCAAASSSPSRPSYQARWDRDAAAAETYTTNSPYLVMDNPDLRQAQQNRPPPTEPFQEPWWQTRNDGRMAVQTGRRSPEIIDYVIDTTDRQRSFGDRIHNIHRRTTRSSQYGRIVR